MRSRERTNCSTLQHTATHYIPLDKSHEIAEAALRIHQCENEKSLAERAKMSEEMRADALQHELDELKKVCCSMLQCVTVYCDVL